MMFAYIAYLLLALVVIIFLLASIRILREYQRGVVFTLGRFSGVKGPGLIILIPFAQQMVKVDLRVVVQVVPVQDVISRDNVSVKVNAVLYFRIVDPERAIIRVEDFMAATSQRGRLPRPDQVSEVCGLRYFGNTFGYLRRGFWPSGRESPSWLVTTMLRLRIARRFSNSCFSALIRADKMRPILSWRSQRSSSGIDSNSNFFADMQPPFP